MLSDWQVFPVVAQYIKKAVSHLVTHLMKKTNKYDLYLKFGKAWKVSLVGHLWPDELFKINKVLAQEDLSVEHSRLVCRWVSKNLTVSTNPKYLKYQFNFENERANKVAQLAKSKQNTSKTACLPSAIDFFVLPTEHMHREIFLPWKEKFITTLEETRLISHPRYITGNPHMQAILEVCYEANTKKRF